MRVFLGMATGYRQLSSYQVPTLLPSPKRSRTVKLLQGLVKEVNATVRGWVGYFHHGNCSKALEHVRGHVEERLRTHLRKRHKIKDRRTGYALYPNRVLYRQYGLYKVPTSAGWTKAHAW
jgi:hypothetical protein